MHRNYISLHNHTAFCDGRDAMEAVAAYAVELGLPAIGFSGHSHVRFDEVDSMTPATAAAYWREIDRLRALYEGRLCIYRGVEQELYTEEAPVGYDYVIGSAHYVCPGGQWICVDAGAETVREGVASCYGGDYMAYAGEYFAAVARLAERDYVDVVGHFDLVTKFNEGGAMFSETDPRYLDAAARAMEPLVKKGKIFEMNSGAVSRGYRTAPYIATPLLLLLREMNAKMTLSADAHRKEDILFRFDEMEGILRDAGFTELWQFDGEAFRPEAL